MSRHKGRRYQPRVRALAFTLAAAFAAGCGEGRAPSVLSALGLIDPATEPPEHVVVLCDNSAGSTCSPQALEQVMGAALHHLAERPGSRITLYVLGSAIADTRLVWAESIDTPSALRPREIEALRKAQLEQARTALLEKAQPYLGRGPLYSSPLLESVLKISVLEPGVHHVVVVSDALEESRLGHWECGHLPDPAALVATLRNEHLLGEASLSASVTFSFRTLAGVDRNRCPVSLARSSKIESLWRAALQAAGAKRISFTAGPPDFAAEDRALQPSAAEGRR
jgi:hypothetical protein